MENGLEDSWKDAFCKPGNFLCLSSSLVFKRVQMLINHQQHQTCCHIAFSQFLFLPDLKEDNLAFLSGQEGNLKNQEDML